MMGRFKQILKKYGKVAMGVHFSVSVASTTGIYVAINNNVDVESILENFGVRKSTPPEITKMPPSSSSQNDPVFGDFENQPQLKEAEMVEMAEMADWGKNTEEGGKVEGGKKKNKTAELVGSSGGAIGLALLLNKALFPIRAPITMLLTPAVARFLARRNLIKNSV